MAILGALCDSLEDSGCVEFLVSGFGQARWPTDVRTDLLTVLEQLPDVSDAIRSGSGEFSLDLYEQGIQRRLDFIIAGKTFTATCVSMTEWRPEPAVVQGDLNELVKALNQLVADFIHVANVRCPLLAKNHLVTAWAESAMTS